jgi:dephospho-CoA kinase
MENKILIVGYAGAGKSTIANKLKDRGYTVISTDDIIKNVVMKKLIKEAVDQKYYKHKELHEYLLFLLFD